MLGDEKKGKWGEEDETMEGLVMGASLFPSFTIHDVDDGGEENVG